MTQFEWFQVLQAIVMLVAGGITVSLRLAWKNSVRQPLADLKEQQVANHERHREDAEKLNAMIGTVANDVARHDAVLESLDKRVDRVEQRQDRVGRT